MSRRSTALVAVPAILFFALTACTPAPGTGTGGAATSGPAEGDAAGATTSECIIGSWQADVADLAEQLAEQLSGSGMNVTSSASEGAQALVIDDAHLGFANSMSFIVTVSMDEGLEMQLRQTHSGNMEADYVLEGDTLTFSNFSDDTYEVHNQVTIGGKTSEASMPMPESTGGDVPTVVTCSGDTMTTAPTGSPFVTTWYRE